MELEDDPLTALTLALPGIRGEDVIAKEVGCIIKIMSGLLLLD